MADDYQMSSLNMAAVNPDFGVMEGLAYDAPYLYVTPHNEMLIAKIDTRTFRIVDTLDLKKVDPHLKGMLGAFVSGGFLYILPHLSGNEVYQDKVARVDLHNFTPAGCSVLKVMDASRARAGLNGRTNGVHGYLNVRTDGMLIVTRFGLGADFKPASLDTVEMSSIAGMPIVQANMVAVDKSAVYVLATVITRPKTDSHNQQTDMGLVTIPTRDFTAKAATFEQLTHVNSFGRTSLPIVIDDGDTLWCPPMPIATGPLAGKFVGVIKIPKAKPAAASVHHGPASQPYPSRVWNSGMPVWDGWRYGYVPSNDMMQILRIDTKNPGSVDIIDISAFAEGYPMFGLGYDGKWMYAISYNGGAGRCLRVLPTQPPGCPCCTDC